MTVNLMDAVPQPPRYPPTSRYYNVPTATWTSPDGRQVPYLQRRPLPQPDTLTVIGTYRVIAADRADLLAYRSLGDAGQWWQITDANLVLDPRDLTAVPGRQIVITLPAGISAGTAA
jgi:hypothetical protein